MKKILTIAFVFILALTSVFGFGCKDGESMDGYYTLSISKSSVTVDGETRKLSDYLEWQDMTLAEYEHNLLGTITIQIEENNLIIFSNGDILANGTFTMDGDNMLCSTEIANILGLVSAQNLKWKNGEVSVTVIYGKYMHNPVYIKTTK